MMNAQVVDALQILKSTNPVVHHTFFLIFLVQEQQKESYK